jgi:hypothetical protein
VLRRLLRLMLLLQKLRLILTETVNRSLLLSLLMLLSLLVYCLKALLL